jgi:hypothetical protein
LYKTFHDKQFIYFLLEFAGRGDLFGIDASDEASEFDEDNSDLPSNDSAGANSDTPRSTESENEDHGSDHRSDHESDHRSDHGSDARSDDRKISEGSNKRSREDRDLNQEKPEEPKRAKIVNGVEEDGFNEEDQCFEEDAEEDEPEGKEFVVKERNSVGYRYDYPNHYQRKEAYCAKMLKQLIHALQYLHSNSVVHRDIKMENILVDENDVLKLSDFGFAHKFKSKTEKEDELCGTIEYMSPENLRERPYRFSPDIWCVGVLAYDMMFGDTPFKAKKNGIMKKKILQCKYSFPQETKSSDELKDFIRRILVKDPHKRLTLSQMLEHPFFKLYE